MTQDLIKAVADEWECPIEQMETLSTMIARRGGTMTGNDRDDLNLVAIAYSRACSEHECTGWLPFNLMPEWESDVFCLLEDEDAWKAAIDANEDIPTLAVRLGFIAQVSTKIPELPKNLR